MTRSPKPGFRPRNRPHLVLVPTQPRGGGTVHGADLTVPWWNPRGEVAAGHDPSSRPGRHLRAITPTSRAENGTNQAVRPAPACLSTRLNEGCPPARSPSGRGHLSLIHISEPTRRTPISYAVFCLKK